MNLVYHSFLELAFTGLVDWETDVFRMLLERDTSAYVPDPDHDFLNDFTIGGGVEISVPSYLRKTLTNRLVNRDLVKDQVELDADNVAFGPLEVGQTVKSLIVYRQTGGTDGTPADDDLVCRIDGIIQVTLAADAPTGAVSLWVEPLVGNIPAGKTLDFGGGGTATVGVAAVVGARQLSVSALGAARSAGAVSLCGTDMYLPAPLGGGNFDVTLDVDGLIRHYFRKG